MIVVTSRTESLTTTDYYRYDPTRYDPSQPADHTCLTCGGDLVLFDGLPEALWCRDCADLVFEMLD